MNNEPKPPEHVKVKRKPLDNLPEPKKVLSLLIIFAVVALVVKFWPSIVVAILGDYSQKTPTDVSPVIFALVAVIALMGLVLMGVWNVRGIWWPFLVASWTNNIILMAFTKNKMISFIRPKEVNWNHIRIDGESTIDPDPDSRYTAPNKVPVLPFIPDHAKTIDPRGLVLDNKKDLSIDINTLDNIGTLNYIKGMKKMTNPMGSLINSGLLWIIMAGGILFFVMWPYFTQQMDNTGKISAMQSTVLQCNAELVSHGLPPIGVTPTTVTATTLPPSNIAQPSGAIKTNPNNI